MNELKRPTAVGYMRLVRRATIAINATTICIAIPACLLNAQHHEQTGYWFGIAALSGAVISSIITRIGGKHA